MKNQEAIGTLETLLMEPPSKNFSTLQIYTGKESTFGREAMQEIPSNPQLNPLQIKSTPPFLRT